MDKINSFKKISTKKNKFVVYKCKNNLKNDSLANRKINLSAKKINFLVIDTNNFKGAKTLKNNKIVYNYNNNSDNNISIEQKSIPNKDNKKLIRRSIYRGVSKNGNKWQVLLMNKKKNYYFGNYDSEKIAANIYDFFAIKLRGKKAITNFIHNDQ